MDITSRINEPRIGALRELIPMKPCDDPSLDLQGGGQGKSAEIAVRFAGLAQLDEIQIEDLVGKAGCEVM